MSLPTATTISNMAAVMCVVWLVVAMTGDHVIHAVNVCTDLSALPGAQTGMMMMNYAFRLFTVSGVMACARVCLLTTQCRSFHYQVGAAMCTLNKIASADDPGSLSSDPDSVFIDVLYIPQHLAGACANHACPPHTFCNEVSGTTTCVPYECSEPPLLAGSTANFDPDTASRSFGSTLSYTCNDGMPPDGTRTCQNDGTWSRAVCRRLGNCAEVKQCNSAYTDGEYWLYPQAFGGGARVRVYCKGLQASNQEEYITLLEGRVSQFGGDPNSCSYSSNGVTYCGKTTSRKIKIADMADMSVDRPVEHDYTDTDCHFMYFAATGTCGSCSGGSSYFWVNMTGTGLIVDPTTVFLGHPNGGYAAASPTWSSSDRVLTMTCTYSGCTKCVPDGFGIKLLLDTQVPEDDSATFPEC